jgi:hypothetical protein
LVAATIVWVASWLATDSIADDEFNDMIPITPGAIEPAAGAVDRA